jgi:BclB C-terminal domain-containing protein
MADINRRISGGCDDERGERGKRGKRGKRGHTGPAGPAGSSAIIPFASGTPDAMAHVLGGLEDTGAVIAFGASSDIVAVGGATIDLSGGVGIATNMAFSMPRAGTLVGLSAFFSSVTAVTIPGGSTANVVVQVYRSTTPNNIFTAVPGALVTLPFPPGLISIGTLESGSASFSVPVSNGDRLLLVARLTVTGTDIITTLTGYISAGLAIA